MILRKLYYKLPAQWRFIARRLWYAPADLWDAIKGRRDPLTPPRGLIYTGRGDFRNSGRKLVQRCIEWGGLQPHHRVLDVGSGIGRAAVALTELLSPEGRYEGFDPILMGVRWCQKHISSRYPNFHFTHIPLANDLYQANGQSAHELRFPYPENYFDFAIVNSVFTHMLPKEVCHYLSELARVLKPQAKAYATFFLYDEYDKRICGMPGFRFPHDHGYYRLMDAQVRTANVAFSQRWLTQQLTTAGFTCTRTFMGKWNGGLGPDFQDVLILQCTTY